MSDLKRVKSVWWSGLPPVAACFDSAGYPSAPVFGQVVGEYLGSGSHYLDLCGPLLEGTSRTGDLLRTAFEDQIHNLCLYPHGPQNLMFEGARWDPTYGSIIRVTGAEDILGPALGRVTGADYATGFSLGRVVVLDVRMTIVVHPDVDVPQLTAHHVDIL
ncbi:hypothetical protein C8R43DRAFT_1130890 [Mycena crocata]|nr:hypothetical protein C8R43DRAFT_1130890 [Mycena crocata]